MYKPAKPTGEALAIASASCSVLNLEKKEKITVSSWRKTQPDMLNHSSYSQNML